MTKLYQLESKAQPITVMKVIRNLFVEFFDSKNAVNNKLVCGSHREARNKGCHEKNLNKTN